MNLQIICLSFLVCNYFAIVGSLNDEGFALLSFKQSMKNYTNSYLNNWNSSDISPCSWKGVTCSGGKVVALTIPNGKLVGFLPTALGKLSALRHVNLRNNNFFGILPVELFDARELQSLVLSGNSLSGPIPPEIGKLKKLQTLDLSHNSFNSSIPSSLDQCKRLKGTLDLSHNFLNGPIPASLGSLPETLYIDLSHNNLSGPIPQNSALSNLGPTAFINNSLLCGAPLKISCSPSYSQSLFHYPSQNSAKNGKGSDPNLGIVITIVASVMVGICLVWLLVYYRCRKISANKDGVNVGGCSFEKALMVRREFFCFAKDNPETLSENIERYNFVQLDQQQPNFDLDQLLKASAFLLGKTGNGIVYKVVLEGGPILAVRRLEEDGGSQRSREFQAEVEAIGKVRHPNIVTLRAYCCSVDEKLIIYDYIPNGDLATAIHGKAGTVPFKPLSWPLRLRIMKGIAKGLAYLHEFSHKRYVHGNLKPSNILLGQNMEPHISDFGLRHLVNIDRESQRTCDLEQMTNGTPQSNSSSEFLPSSPSVTAGSCYQAPEAFKVSRPSQKWDVYSFGVILLEMISGKFPIIKMGVLEVNLVQWIQLSVEERKPLSSVLDPFMAHDIDKEKEIVDVVQIALACVQKNPERRPSMRFVCENLERLVSSTY